MILESLLVLAVLAVILVFFYKQGVREFRILQVDSIDKAQQLLNERSPIVVLPAPTAQNLWTRADLDARPSLAKSAFNGLPLKEAIQKPSFTLKTETAEMLAEKSGVSIWANQHLLPAFKTGSWWTPCLTARTEVAIGAQGLRQTYGYTTLLMATENAIQVSLLNESSNPYLPDGWEGKRLAKMTRDDAPFLPQIKFVDVIVRPGSALLIPPHWKVCWENLDPKETALTVLIEIHHPVSRALYNMMRRQQRRAQKSQSQQQLVSHLPHPRGNVLHPRLLQ
jgi:hypothetical protein